MAVGDKILRFDEARLKGDLAPVPARLRVAFACACAQRQFDAYIRYCQQGGKGDPNYLRKVLDQVWEFAAGGQAPLDLDDTIERCTGLVPEEDDSWTAASAYADDAVSAVIYALRACREGDPQEAAWAARRAYEATDHYATNLLDVNFNQRGAEEAVLGHPLVQNELNRQHRDVNELVSASSAKRERELISALRNRAVQEAKLFTLDTD